MNRLCAALILAATSGGLAAAANDRKGTLVQQAPANTLQLVNPYEGDERAAAAGAKLYRRECAACHGKSGEGFQKAPPLDRPDVKNAPAGALFWVLRNGSLHHGMPSFSHLPEPRRWQIITYIRSLSHGASPLTNKK